jgi:hypothetical protein
MVEPMSSRRIVLVAALVLLLVAAVAVAIALSRDDDARGDSNAEIACELLDDLPEDLALEDLDLEKPAFFELQAVGSLAQAAANADHSFDDLGEAGLQAMNSLRSLDTEELTDALDELRSQCEEID